MTEYNGCPIRGFENRDPYEFYEQIRSAPTSSIWDDELNAWVIADYESCAAIHREETVFHHPYETLPGSFKVKGEQSILLLKGEEHRRLHAWYSRWFRSKAEELATEVVAPLASRLVEQLDTSGEFDLAEGFADPLPVNTLGVLFGLEITDDAHLERCKVLNDQLTRWSETFAADDSVVIEATAAAEELSRMLLPAIRDRREHPRDDFLSDLWAAGPTILDRWDETTMLDQAKTIFPAGGHTTANFICNALYLLLADPHLLARVRADQTLIPRMVEEALRLAGPIHIRVREARTKVELDSGLQVEQGQRVHPLLAAAGRDPGRHSDPTKIVLDRDRPRHHMAFGLGTRLCVGAELARSIAAEALRAVLSIPGVRLADPRVVPELTGFLARSYRPVTCVAG